MPIFSKPPIDEVYDLINLANAGPDWIPVTKTNVLLGVPAPATVPGNSAMNTKIMLNSLPNADFIGRKEVNYRRRDMAVLFRSITIQIERYSANQGAAAGAGAVVFSVYSLLPLINAKYGINLTQDDVVDQNITRGSTLEDGFYTRTVTVATKATSLAYTGSFALKWKGAPQDLSSMITVTDLNARMYPGGNDFTGERRPIMSNAAYAYDWSGRLATNPWSGYPNSFVVFGNYPLSAQFLNFVFGQLNADLGTAFPINAAWNGVPNNVFEVVTLPSTKYPEANSEYFNRLLTWETPESMLADFGPGRNYVHFNV